MPRRPAAKSVETLKHDAGKRKNIPTAELQSVLNDAEQKPVETRYARQGAAPDAHRPRDDGARRRPAREDAQAAFVRAFVAAWNKVMNLDRFDLA